MCVCIRLDDSSRDEKKKKKEKHRHTLDLYTLEEQQIYLCPLKSDWMICARVPIYIYTYHDMFLSIFNGNALKK